MPLSSCTWSHTPISLRHILVPTANEIIPDMMGISGDIILLIIIMIIVLVMAAFIIKFLNETHELAVQLEKEIEYSKEQELRIKSLQDRLVVLKGRIDRLKMQIKGYEMYAQDVATQMGQPSQEYGYPEATAGDYSEIEVVQHYEEIPMAEGQPVGDKVWTSEEVMAQTPEETKEKKDLPVAKPIIIPPPPKWDDDNDFVIQDVFVIYKDGRLISHLSKKIRIIDDSQIIGSMITAVQMCVRESFKRESRGSLGAMKFGEISILMENGEFLNLAVVLRGTKYEELKRSMKDTLKTIHEAWGDGLEDWDGSLTHLGALEKIIQRDLIDRFDTEVFHAPTSKSLDLSKAKVFKPQ
jgi:hypothetical protein